MGEVKEVTKVKSKRESLLDIEFNDTSEISVPPRLIDQVIGQDNSVEIIKKAALQRRHVLLIGEPGTGKSMLGMAMAELLPKEELVDVLCIPNPKYPNQPRVATLPAGHGARKVEMDAEVARKSGNKRFIISLAILLAIIGYALIATAGNPAVQPQTLLMAMFVGFFIFFMLNQSRGRTEMLIPKLLVDNSKKDTAPFNDATGSHAGALLGDVRHDPFQSGGLGTPPHERVESGLIHKSNLGVLYSDEIGTLEMRTQQKLLTAMQEGKLQITGQSELSSGAMVRTDPVPCSFVLIAAGNIETTRNMHPALRSRIQGSGYEVYMKDTMPDTPENRRKLARFCAQEIVKDRRIPHFTHEAVEEMIYEAQRRADRKSQLTLRLRELGGLIRAAGDLSKEMNEPLVTAETVRSAKTLARTLENQISDSYADDRKLYKIFETEDVLAGRVNGLAVINQRSGIVMPIEAEVVPAFSRREGKIVATGQLRIVAREAVQNVSAIVKKYVGKDISDYDYHIQFVGAYAGVEGDSASVSIAAAIISAMEKAPIRQDTAMTGSLTVRGVVIPVGGVTAKIEAAVDAGIKRVIIPIQNFDDVKIEEKYKGKVEIIPVRNFHEVLREALSPDFHYVADKYEELALDLPISKENNEKKKKTKAK
ncbi:MAG: ATP-dependent protease LonB [Candidatus Heimdallarchaeota archaeon]|nr:ATP-dependent protease LonB [Candidatus Heimdallarchaeota archaeon]MCK4877513.1 ATP-dependent protease LonB [Candidatus Heimdallarchaeota archaeon]